MPSYIGVDRGGRVKNNLNESLVFIGLIRFRLVYLNEFIELSSLLFNSNNKTILINKVLLKISDQHLFFHRSNQLIRSSSFVFFEYLIEKKFFLNLFLKNWFERSHRLRSYWYWIEIEDEHYWRMMTSCTIIDRYITEWGWRHQGISVAVSSFYSSTRLFSIDSFKNIYRSFLSDNRNPKRIIWFQFEDNIPYLSMNNLLQMDEYDTHRLHCS
jgi:hypothetical protein